MNDRFGAARPTQLRPGRAGVADRKLLTGAGAVLDAGRLVAVARQPARGEVLRRVMQGLERRGGRRREQELLGRPPFNSGTRAAARFSVSMALERKVVSFPPVTVISPSSSRMRRSRVSFDGSTSAPEAITGRTPDQVDTTSASPSPSAENSDCAALST